MYTIREATNAFVTLDGLRPDQSSALDKALRNLSQRLYLPPIGRDGRADTYALETICALRLLYKASSFGLDRWQLEKLARFLQIVEPLNNGPRENFSGGWRLLSPIEEAIQRARHGETFNIGVSMLRDGTVKVFADWRAELETSALAETGHTLLPEDACFNLPASRLIVELIGELEPLN